MNGPILPHHQKGAAGNYYHSSQYFILQLSTVGPIKKLPEEGIEMREGGRNPTNQEKVTISQYSTRPIKKDSTRETSSRRIPPKPSSRCRGNNSLRDLPLLLPLRRASTAKRRRRVGRTNPRIIIAASRDRNSHTLLIRIVLPSAAYAHTSCRTRERRSG